jgi:hypothetical protein
MRNLFRCSLLLLSVAALLAGCSDSNQTATEDVHPPVSVWYQQHRTATTVATYVDDCGGCHVVNEQPGPAVPPSCFSVSYSTNTGVFQCHANGPGAPHLMDGTFLQGDVHGPVAKRDLTFCQGCHSSNPTGGPGSNPNFDLGINNPEAPVPGTGCEQCHGVNLAHPAAWAGPNNTFHYSAGNIQGACTLCHGVNLDGVNGSAGAVSCLDCHAEATNLTLDCTACHGLPPDGTAEPVVGGTPVNHTAVPLGSHDQCATCHGVKNSVAGTTGDLNPSANYLAFNKVTDTIGDHWNGQINMNGPSALDPSNTSGVGVGAGYNSANFGCDLACHANDAPHQMSDSSLPVAFGDYGSGAGGGAPHPTGADWLRVSQHATAAVIDPASCVGCHTLTGGGIDPPCQGCHQVAPLNDLTTAGCPSCHSYPPDGVTPVATQPNLAGKHAEHVAFTADTANCSSCHQGGGTDSLTHYDRVGQTTPNYPAEVSFLATYNAQSGAASYNIAPAQTCSAVSCHGGQVTPDWPTGTLPTTAPTTSNVYCLSCHAAGTSQFNSYNSGEHTLHVNGQGLLCVNCHNTTVLQNGVGGVGPTHWGNLATPVLNTPAFELDPASTVGGAGTFVTSYDGTSCLPLCHGSEVW